MPISPNTSNLLAKKKGAAVTAFLLVLLLATLPFSVLGPNLDVVQAQVVQTQSLRTWTVDDDSPADFHTIQAAINIASNGDTVFVRMGNYTENVVVNRTISLVGETGERRPVIWGNRAVAVVKVTANNVSIGEFDITNGGYGDSYGDGLLGGGIELFGVSNCVVANNSVHDNMACGISLVNANRNTLSNNTCARNWVGIRLWAWSPKTTNFNIIHNNTCSENLRNGINLWSYVYMTWVVNYNNITDNLVNNSTLQKYYGGIDLGKSKGDYVAGNIISSNYGGIHLESSSGCTFFHNSFVGNTIQVEIADLDEGASSNLWDLGFQSGGNYWSDYNGTDANKDGLGDTPYAIDANNVDRYPLMSFLDFTTPNNKSSTLVPSENPSESEHVLDGAGNVTIAIGTGGKNLTMREPHQGETNGSGTVPVDVKLESESPFNLLTVLFVALVIVVPVVLTIYCAKMAAPRNSRSLRAWQTDKRKPAILLLWCSVLW